MKENHGSKLKSILVVMTMLLAALTAGIVMFGSVSAAPGGFYILTPVNNTYYKPGNILNISWTAANATGTIGYNVTIYYNGVALPGPPGNLSTLYATGPPINTNVDRGMYKISVHAWNWTDNTKTYAYGDNHSINITEGIPGYDIWQSGNFDITGTNNLTMLNTSGIWAKGKVLNTSTTDLKFDSATKTTIEVNTSAGKGWTGATTYYLFYPVYEGSDTVPYNLSWRRYDTGDGPTPKFVAGTGNTFGDKGEVVKLNRSGIWIIDDGTSTDANMSTFNKFNSTVPAWFWVNASDDELTVSTDVDTLEYGDKTEITLTTNKKAVVDVRAFSNNQTILGGNAYTGSDMEYSFWTNTTITHVGKYEIYAYKDNDSTVQYWDFISPFYYDYNYGNGTIGLGTGKPVDYYTYAFCGPYDSPEWTQTAKGTITVDKGEPNIILSNYTIYWGFESRIDINVTDDYGKGLTGGADKILIKNCDSPPGWIGWGHAANGSAFMIRDLSQAPFNQQPGNYSFNISRGAANWKQLYTAYGNGTWNVYYAEDKNSDGKYEWNYSKDFQVSGSPPSARIVIDDDGNGTKSDEKVDVPVYTGGGTGPANAQTLLFTIYGNTVTGAVTDYYGDDPWEDDKNITISGDILYPVTPTYVANGQWKARVTPTKNGGSYKIAVTWNTTNTDLEKDISIVNGTTATTSADVIYVGQHTNLTVTVRDMENDPVKDATVYLFKKGVGGVALNQTTGDGITSGNGAGGEYTFWLTPKNFTAAPDNITIAVKAGATNKWGYAKVEVQKQHNMIVNVTPTTSYAGNSTKYTVTVSLEDGGNPATTGLTVALYNETGVLVPSGGAFDDSWSHAGSYDFTDTKALSGGIYYLYAYNNTHDSRGNNATIVVTEYIVTPTPDKLAWLIDTSINLTFSVEPAFSGMLHIENMTGLPNCSAGGAEFTRAIEDGVGTLANVNATTLGNVTFDFAPTGGIKRPADGILRVTTAAAESIPPTIYLNEPTLVTIKLTHPATGEKIKSGVRVGLDHGKNLSTSILAKLPTDQFTDANGEVEFSITAEASGNATIYIMNGTDPENPFIIKAAVRRTMTLETDDPTVNEAGTFTVTALYNGEAITDATVYITFAGNTTTTTTGIAELTAPLITETVDYKIKATAEGYSDAQTEIKVLNLPSLYITISGTKDGDKYISPVTVTVYSESGAMITGATVTFGTTTATTVNGQATITVEKETTGEMTATFTGFTAATPVTITIKPAGIPGFELLTLIAAIGVALILLRRRRR